MLGLFRAADRHLVQRVLAEEAGLRAVGRRQVGAGAHVVEGGFGEEGAGVGACFDGLRG